MNIRARTVTITTCLGGLAVLLFATVLSQPTDSFDRARLLKAIQRNERRGSMVYGASRRCALGMRRDSRVRRALLPLARLSFFAAIQKPASTVSVARRHILVKVHYV